MEEKKNWMLMTYYCPTHGESGIVNPIEITKKEIIETFSKKNRNSKIINKEYCQSLERSDKS